MTEKRFTIKEFSTLDAMSSLDVICDNGIELPSSTACDLLNELNEENEQLKKGMIEVVDRYIRNIEHNPPSSVRTYLKVKGALVNVREGLRDLLERV